MRNEKTGFLFEPGNFEDLVAKLKWLIENPKKKYKIGEEARKRVKENFDIFKVVKSNLENYNKLCRRN